MRIWPHRPVLSPRTYDDWKAREPAEDGEPYPERQAASNAHFRMTVMQAENAYLAEHPELRDEYNEWHRQWGRRRG